MRRFLTRIRRGGDEGSPALRVWTALTVLVSVFAITAHEDFGALRFSIAGLVALGFLFSWIRRRRNNTWVKLLLTAGCLWAAWVFLQALSQDPYHTSIPLTIFLLWLQTLHSFDLPRRRDLLFSVLTSVVLMAVAAAFTVDMAFGAFFLPYALAACVTLVYNTAEAGMAAAAGGGSAASDPAPAAPPRPALQRGEAVPIAAALLGALLAVAGLVFLFTPRLSGLFITTLPFTPTISIGERLQGGIINPAYPQGGDGTQVFNPNGYFGFGPNVDLRVRGRLNDRVVMRVRTTERRNWRGLVFDVYTAPAGASTTTASGCIPPRCRRSSWYTAAMTFTPTAAAPGAWCRPSTSSRISPTSPLPSPGPSRFTCRETTSTWTATPTCACPSPSTAG